MTDDLQLPLFRRLPSRGAKRKRRRSRIIVFIERVIGWVQLDLQLPDPPPWVDPYSDGAYDFPEHRVVRAEEAAPVRTRAPASIFAFAALIKRSGRRQAHFAQSAPAPLPAVAVQRDGEACRVVGAAYPANRWTEERAEKERIRRAKQRPPKPTAAAKGRRSRKLLELIGEAED